MIQRGWVAIAAMVVVCSTGFAQDPERRVRVERDVFLTAPDAQSDVMFTRKIENGQEHGTFAFIHSEMGIAGKVVKNAPYTAEAVTENTQTLADGNRIAHKSTTSLARDAEGRTRRETTLGNLAPLGGPGGAAHQIIFIHDPVASVSYTLDPRKKTARKMMGVGMALHFEGPASGAVPGLRVDGPPPVELREGVKMSVARVGLNGKPTAKTESLGKRTIEGVVADGTRETRTIPAGEIGNDRPIEIVNERWYSEELQTIVMSKHSDPRMGEHTYRLSSLRKGEPSRLLFEVPADYTLVTEDKLPMMRRKMRDTRE